MDAVGEVCGCSGRVWVGKVCGCRVNYVCLFVGLV